MDQEDLDRNFIYRHRVAISLGLSVLTLSAVAFILFRQNVRLSDVYVIELEILDNLETIENNALI